MTTELSPEARDFAPDLLTLQESPPSRLPRAALLLVALLVGLLVGWAAWAELDIVASAQGRLVPVSFTKVVQPAEPGVVTEILVKDGDQVKAGQVLVRLDARLFRADAGMLDHDAELRRLTILRLVAELANRPLHLPPTSSTGLALQVTAQYVARRQSHEDALAQERAALKRAEAELGAAEQTLIKLRAVVPIVRNAAEKNEQLEHEGFVSALSAADRRREYLEKSHDLETQVQAVSAVKAGISQQQKRLNAVQSSYRTQLENDLMENQAQLNRISQEKGKSDVRVGQLESRAPTDGVVKDLAVTSIGAVVQAGALLMNIVPQGEALQAEISLGNEDAGFVVVGQRVQLKVAAFPFQKYGLLAGVVTHIGADATQVQGAQQPPTYRALVRLANDSLATPQGAPLILVPGMLVVAEIHQGKRSVLEYMLSPVQKVGAESGRER